MRRLARHALNALTALSLVLCVATAALWVRSYFSNDGYFVRRSWNRELGAAAHRGSLYVSSKHVDPEETGAYSGTFSRPVGFSTGYDGSVELPEWSRFGFGWERFESNLVRFECVGVPCWFLVVLSAGLPIARSVRHVRRRGAPADRCCCCCGYDLRATPDRCPECGTRVGCRLARCGGDPAGRLQVYVDGQCDVPEYGDDGACGIATEIAGVRWFWKDNRLRPLFDEMNGEFRPRD